VTSKNPPAGGRVIRKLLRDAQARIGLRGWIAICAILVAALTAPGVLRSRFVTERRAAMSLKGARAHVAAHQLEEARGDFRAALRLRPADAAARLELAAVDLELGDWELAFLEYQSLTELHPEDPDGWTALASVLIKGGLLVAPEAALDKAIALAPDRADARVLRADIRSRLGRYHGAHLDAQAAVQHRPQDAASWVLLVRTAARSQGTPAGVEAAARGVAAVGQDPALVRLRDWLSSERGTDPAALAPELGPPPVAPGRVRAETQRNSDKLAALAQEHWPGRLAQMRQALDVQLRQQDWTAARRTVESAGRSYPDSAFAAFLAGIVELAQGNTGEAERQLSASLAAAPRSPVIATALAKAWSREKGAAFAGERLMRLAERDPGFAFARLMAARAYMDARDPVQAEAALRSGLQLQPDSPAPYQQLADHYLDLDRAPDALGICHQGLERFPRDVDLQATLARISADLGRAGEAIPIYEGILSRRPDLDVVEYKLAALLADEGAPSQRLLEIARRLRSDSPSDPLLLDTLGWMHYRAGDTARGRDLLQAAVNAAPDEPGPHFHLAAVYSRENKTELARTELKAAVESKRPFAGRLDAMRLLRENSPAPRP
jgi:tetratricopeptide (TPR) repeat protein